MAFRSIAFHNTTQTAESDISPGFPFDSSTLDWLRGHHCVETPAARNAELELGGPRAIGLPAGAPRRTGLLARRRLSAAPHQRRLQRCHMRIEDVVTTLNRRAAAYQ